MSMEIDFFGKRLTAYKANLHTHTPLSDGGFTPEQLIERYGSAGYDVFAFSDHRKTNPVSTYDGKGMTLLSGIEMHPAGPRGILWHILALGVPEDFTYNDAGTGQEAVDSALAAGAVVFCAHPYWCGFTSAEVASLKGIYGIEVYNTSCRSIGREYNMQCWDELLGAGYKFTALAVDDVHGESHLFRGFTMIAAEDNSPESLISALKSGSFYASQGPLFHSIRFENKVLKAEFTPATTAICVMNRSRGRCFTMPDHTGPGTGTKEVTELEFDLSGSSGNYVRIQLCDADGRMAWSNPVYIG